MRRSPTQRRCCTINLGIEQTRVRTTNRRAHDDPFETRLRCIFHTTQRIPPISTRAAKALLTICVPGQTRVFGLERQELRAQIGTEFVTLPHEFVDRSPRMGQATQVQIEVRKVEQRLPQCRNASRALPHVDGCFEVHERSGDVALRLGNAREIELRRRHTARVTRTFRCFERLFVRRLCRIEVPIALQRKCERSKRHGENSRLSENAGETHGTFERAFSLVVARRKTLRQTHHRKRIRSDGQQRAWAKTIGFFKKNFLFVSSILVESRPKQRFFREFFRRCMVTCTQEGARRMKTKRTRKFDIVSCQHFVTHPFEFLDRASRFASIGEQARACNGNE